MVMQNYINLIMKRIDLAWEKLNYNAKVNVIWVAIWGVGLTATGMIMVFFRSKELPTGDTEARPNHENRMSRIVRSYPLGILRI